MKRLLLLAAIACLSVACATPYNSPTFNAKPGSSAEFEGIADILVKHRQLDVLLVHGMCTHDADWATGAVQNLYGTMGGDPSEVKLEDAAVGVTGITLYQQTLPLRYGSLRVNAIRWSPLTTPLKLDLCYDQTKKSEQCAIADGARAYPYKRATLNRKMKDGLLNDCLADALIYQGKSRIAINKRMQDAIVQAVTTSGGQAASSTVTSGIAEGNTVPMVIITDSLGSKVTFDAINKLAETKTDNKDKLAIQLLDRTQLVFMRANQIPILALADRSVDDLVAASANDDEFPEDPLQALIQKGNPGPGPKSVLQPTVVAFSDPNDLLSFALVGSRQAARASYPIVDVIVSNAVTYLHAVELPNLAHQHYKYNKAVGKLIACGNKQPSACK